MGEIFFSPHATKSSKIWNVYIYIYIFANFPYFYPLPSLFFTIKSWEGEHLANKLWGHVPPLLPPEYAHVLNIYIKTSLVTLNISMFFIWFNEWPNYLYILFCLFFFIFLYSLLLPPSLSHARFTVSLYI